MTALPIRKATAPSGGADGLILSSAVPKVIIIGCLIILDISTWLNKKLAGVVMIALPFTQWSSCYCGPCWVTGILLLQPPAFLQRFKLTGPFQQFTMVLLGSRDIIVQIGAGAAEICRRLVPAVGAAVKKTHLRIFE